MCESAFQWCHFLNLIYPFGLTGLLDVETQAAVNDDGRECSVKDSLIHTGQNRTFPVVCVKPHLICKKVKRCKSETGKKWYDK